MKHSTCLKCQKSLPVNKTYKVFEELLCEDCANEKLKTADQQNIKDGDVVPQIDPTVCSNCGMDNGSSELSTLSNVPLCEKCQDYFKHMPFPAWVKIGFVAILLLLAYTFERNKRFFMAYLEANRGGKAASAGNFELARDKFRIAAGYVPEAKDLPLVAGYFDGMVYSAKGDYLKALPLVKAYADAYPSFVYAKTALLLIESSLAFDRKDYEEFYRLTERLNSIYPGEPLSMLRMASALACKYVVSKDEAFKKQASEYVSKAEGLVKGEEKALLDEYKERIMHRLQTREILSPDDFKKKYPNGWNRSKK